MSRRLLEVQSLGVNFNTPDGEVRAVESLSFSLDTARCLGIVGESGSGKSQAVLSIMGLLAENGTARGSVRFRGQELLGSPVEQLNQLRGRDIAMIFQDPLTSLTPHLSIGRQMLEVLEIHNDQDSELMQRSVLDALDLVRIPDAKSRMHQYPHQLSGGMRQRVMIAMSILCKPSLLIADEPTTALDVTVQRQILDILSDLRSELGTALILISHDLGVIAGQCDECLVMKSGVMVEQGRTDDIFYKPQEQYTRELLQAVPRMDSDVRLKPCSEETVLKVENICRVFDFDVGGGWLSQRRKLRAVDGVDFELNSGETLGIVGESGCGKSTLARAVLNLIKPSQGRVLWMGRETTGFDIQQYRDSRKDLQIIFQDPLASLNPRMTIGDSIAEPLWTHEPTMTPNAVGQRVVEMMSRVGLDPAWINRYPHEFSGGQNQRVGIARAMILQPGLVIADEAVSALDVTIQNQIIELLRELQEEYGLAMLFISHDLSVVRQLSHRIMVLYMGRVVEIGPAAAVCENPRHPYTRSLIAAVPVADPAQARTQRGSPSVEEVLSPLDSRAPLRYLQSRVVDDPTAEQYRPQLQAVAKGHYVAEHDVLNS